MKKTMKTALALALALCLALAAIPASALPRFDVKAEVTPNWTVPDGYNVHDYTKCVEFLEQTDEDGVKNGTKLSENYDPNDPNTWRAYCFMWHAVNDELRILHIWLGSYDFSLNGELDISGCTELETLESSNNNISELNVSGCTALKYLYCDCNNLSELNVTECAELKELSCLGNNLTELDVSRNPELYSLNLIGSRLTELDLSINPYLAFEYLRVEGSGWLDYTSDYSVEAKKDGLGDDGMFDVFVRAYPSSGASFEGFYYESGELLDEGYYDDMHDYYLLRGFYHSADDLPQDRIIARFSGGFTPGDIDGNGSVSVADAISTLRLSMGISDGSGLNTDAADMDGNGSVTLADAIIILRMAMGLA